MIGDKIVITVLEVRGTSIRLGIDAPKEITVVRTENMIRCDLCGDTIRNSNRGQETEEGVICGPCLRKHTERAK